MSGADASFHTFLPPVTVLTMRSLFLMLLLGLTCVGATAQDKIYKVRLPDGRILFTDRPPPGASIVSEREAPPPSAPAPAPAARTDTQPGSQQEQAVQADARLRERTAEIDKAFAAVQAAERDLETSRKQLEEGRAPVEGEMIATARGRVRPSPAYQERIGELEKAVVAAEQRLGKAREGLTAVR
jgi:Domain of unknown function (DUF4124)